MTPHSCNCCFSRLTVLCTATVYPVYYKPILQLIFLLLPNGFPTLSFRANQSAPVANIKSRRSIGQCPMLPNGSQTFWLEVPPIGHRIKIQKLKIHWSICNVWGPFDAKFHDILTNGSCGIEAQSFSEKPRLPRNRKPGWANFCIKSLPPCGGFVLRNRHAVTCVRAGL